MEQAIQMTGGELAAVHAARPAGLVVGAAGATGATCILNLPLPLPVPDIPDPTPDLFTREATIAVLPRDGEPKRIGQLLEPIQRIIRHPDRNRLMAEFCKRHW